MKTNYEFCIVDPNNEVELAEYERTCYQAFLTKAPDKRAIEKSIIENERMRSKIPYNDLIQYAVKYNGKTIGGIKFHTNINNIFDTERIFKISKNDGDIEGINFFILDDKNNDVFDKLDIIARFSEYYFFDLKSKDYKNMYGYCSEKIKIVYIRCGCNILDKIKIGDETVLLLKREI